MSTLLRFKVMNFLVKQKPLTKKQGIFCFRKVYRHYDILFIVFVFVVVILVVFVTVLDLCVYPFFIRYF